MKSSTLFFLFLLSAFFTSYLPSVTANFVFDSEGDVVKRDFTYSLMPYIEASSGGIELVATGKETCPLTVVQTINAASYGLPIRIISSPDSYFLYEGTKVRIGFAFPPQCAPSPWWTVAKGLPEGPAVKLSAGYQSTVDGWFRIKSVPSEEIAAYKLQFCAREDNTCGDIGIYRDREGYRRLVMAKKNPLVFVFVQNWKSTA